MKKILVSMCSLITIFLASNGASFGHMPPQIAVNACYGKAVGDSCDFQARGNRYISGACNSIRQVVACVPGDRNRNSTRERRMQAPMVGNNQNMQRQGGRKLQPSPGGKSEVVAVTKVNSRIVDTNQKYCFDNAGVIDCPKNNRAFSGQDAQYLGARPSYINNYDGTVTDLNTKLVWQKAHNSNRLTFYDAKRFCENLSLGNRRNWRLPSLKELYSLADFSGAQGKRHYINTQYFELEYPSSSVLTGDRHSTHRVEMMGQTWSNTIYAGDHYGRRGVKGAFFFNFFDAHIKQAPLSRNKLFYRCVSGKKYGVNYFVDNRNQTITDRNSGLVWQKTDDGRKRNWKDSLKYCESLRLAGYTDWRLPNIKELQSIVDYTTNNPAIDLSFFNQTDSKGWFWSSTTHGDNINMADYIAFGKAVSRTGIDTHGAGAQRSDPKSGNPSNYSHIGGGQNDEIRIYNYARCVRN